ncbi:MAG: hypothetical protein E6K70_22495 [Planctomycetota bacterium]|nr:MAG: hypothetical protein E6K70_22495 [Planctomycetota bacterium]
MLRRGHWIAAVFAVVVVMLAADASQARERRLLGRRGRGNTYDNSSYYPPAGYYTGPSDVQFDDRVAGYYTPPGYSTSTGQMPVYIDVVIPPRAEITFENERTYTYHIKAKWTENGREVTRSRTVPVHAGERVMVDLTSTSTEDRREE